MQLEAKGRPTVVITTTMFSQLAQRSALQSGLPDARIAVVPHPVGGISQAELSRLADAATEDVMNRLLGR